MKISLPDVNTWTALAVAGHRHYAVARAWFTVQPNDTVAFCRVTQMGLLRLLTNRSALGSGASTIPQAWETYQALRADRRVVFVSEPDNLEVVWAALTKMPGVGPSSWTDAYLAAFAREHGHTFVTFDRAFSRWPGLALTVLTAPQS